MALATLIRSSDLKPRTGRIAGRAGYSASCPRPRAQVLRRARASARRRLQEPPETRAPIPTPQAPLPARIARHGNRTTPFRWAGTGAVYRNIIRVSTDLFFLATRAECAIIWRRFELPRRSRFSFALRKSVDPRGPTADWSAAVRVPLPIKWLNCRGRLSGRRTRPAALRASVTPGGAKTSCSDNQVSQWVKRLP